MKKIIIALAILGFTYAGAEAQTKACVAPVKKVKVKKVVSVAHHRMHTATITKNYQVCTENDGSYQYRDPWPGKNDDAEDHRQQAR